MFPSKSFRTSTPTFECTEKLFERLTRLKYVYPRVIKIWRHRHESSHRKNALTTTTTTLLQLTTEYDERFSSVRLRPLIKWPWPIDVRGERIDLFDVPLVNLSIIIYNIHRRCRRRRRRCGRTFAPLSRPAENYCFYYDYYC